MMKGSVNTFLNAMTYPDKTLYPAASVLEKDFFNLLYVYGDAVFFPLLKKEVFRQEGHRLEWDEEDRLRRVGIVYNEMKGNYSSQEGIASEWTVRALFPDTPYHVDSGGEPDVIPRLTYEQFLAFHDTWYHPSNCRIFLYGNIPSEKTLAFLDEKFLSLFDRKEIDSTVPLQTSWDTPRELEKTWPSSEEDGTEGKTTLTLNWKTCNAADPVLSLSLAILTEMMLGNAGAPLYKALQQSGLGEDLSPVSGVDFDLNESVFTVALRGTDPEKKDDFLNLVMKVLTELSDEGFDPGLMESCLRIVEFRAREIKGGGPFGLRLLKKTMRGWNYDYPPSRTIRFDPVMEEVRRRAARPGYFEGLLKELLIENNHRTLVVVRPDPGSRSRQEQSLREELDRLAEQMSSEDRDLLQKENEALDRFQQEPDGPEERATIPFLRKDDIPRAIRTIPGTESDDGPVKVFRQNVFTNGILYTDMSFDLSGLDDRFAPWLPLFCKVLSGTGLPGIPFDVVSQEISLKTGGFGASLEAGHPVGRDRNSDPDRYLYVRLKMLEGLRDEALSLGGDLLLKADFDNHERIRQIVTELRNDMKASLIPGGHSYVALRTTRRLSRAAAMEDLWFGIDQFRFLEALPDLEDESFMKEVSAVLKQIRRAVFVQSGLTLSLTMDESVMERHGAAVVRFWRKALPAGPETAGKPSALLPGAPKAAGTDRAEGLSISALVGFVGASLEGTELGTPEHTSQLLLSHLLKTGPLWEKIRMKGGAYGAFSSLSGLEKTFSFTTYRDPHIEDSLDAFRESLEEFTTFQDEEELEKSLISIIGKEMKPLSPSEKGMIALKRHLYCISDDLRQLKRDQLMERSAADIRDAASGLLEDWENAEITVMAHPDHLDRASERWKGLKIQRIELTQ